MVRPDQQPLWAGRELNKKGRKYARLAYRRRNPMARKEKTMTFEEFYALLLQEHEERHPEILTASDE